MQFETCDVFTTTRHGGNPLAVVHGAAGLETAAMQAIAREFNLSETVFVLEAEAAAARARIRIFTTARELPFAGHPNVGAAVLMARRLGLPGDRLLIEQPAGIVEARLGRDAAGEVTAATITAPRAFELGATLDAAGLAACAGLEALVGEPVMASCGTPFALAEVADAARLAEAAPDAAAFRAHLPADRAVGLLLYTRLGPNRLRARMFAPLSGVAEDPATGSANVALAGLLLQRSGGEALALEVEQGIEMGRPSLLRLAAHTTPNRGIRVSVGGSVVPVSAGRLFI
ncbi:PhzF family phenazine biosynthesis protein [Falsiroseomonas selenitidurans]|uniref:PhzF family phenazine biosynthesis protein n=1 Tax=Falsiroseomonas selenitidurans TaxID=2716335 RepID=A0ABX1EEK5_9PROT|nr:PhzF family phenazine biosynthesis protein [Falsiroseomonas selenitidurans]NKC34377.1 PhzF family phenazine biosynthesis protein [Falsiroseomonas selenitidurans]